MPHKFREVDTHCRGDAQRPRAAPDTWKGIFKRNPLLRIRGLFSTDRCPMRLATLTFIGAIGAIAVPAGAVPVVPEPLKSPHIIEVADGCGLGFHRYRGSCVSHSQYRADSNPRPYDWPAPLSLPLTPNGPAQGYPYSGGGYRTAPQNNYGN